MPRQARLDAPGVLQHVMARGIERRKIFKDDKDRQSFLERLALILEKTQTQCYAWALIPNHFHLLLRTGPFPLSTVMRRLMTGYAVTFNRRHRRAGHLFQNRYKSVVCEEDPYLLELIRYIHLNPLRAKLVEDLKALDKYPWTGHSAILGRRKNPLILHITKDSNKVSDEVNSKSKIQNPCPVKREACLTGAKSEISLAHKTTMDVLLHFGNTVRIARRRYRQFVKNGIEQGRRSELQGGGLVRSAGGNKVGLLGRKKEEREKGDERILGSGDFVIQVLGQKEKEHKDMGQASLRLPELITKVVHELGITREALISKSRDAAVSEARAIISFLGTRKLGETQTEIQRYLKISRIGVRNCIIRCEKMIDKCDEIWEKLI